MDASTAGGMRRRELILAGATGAAALSLGATPGWARRRPPVLSAGTFPSGVMAGEPHPHGAILWTQLGPGEAPGRLHLEVAADPDFRRVVERRTVPAHASRDLVARVRLNSPRFRPHERYWYRFATSSSSTPVGRFTTMPPSDSNEPLRIGFFSCQDYDAGYYTAHAALAREDCDAIVCLGDYIYENNSPGDVPGRADTTSAAESGECELLPEYRAKYRLYRSDGDLRDMHAATGFFTTWDDHEVEDNYADGHEGKTGDVRPPRRIPYAERRANAYATFFEQMPIATVLEERTRLYRRFSLGGMVDLFLLDLRQYRSDQVCSDTPIVPCFEEGPPGHTLLGPAQKDWLKSALPASRAAWKVLASSVEMMGWDSVPGIKLNHDGWDGYSAERKELGNHLLATSTRNVAVITGDVHHFATGVVTTDGRFTGRPFATEFIGGSITSPFPVGGPAAQLAELTLQTNPHLAYTNFSRRGYGVLEATNSELRVRYRSPATIEATESPVSTIAEFRVPRNVTEVERVS